MRAALSAIGVRLVYGLLWIWGGLVFLTPWPVKRGLARVAGLGLWTIAGRRRKVILHNLTRAFPRAEYESLESYRRRLEAIGRAHCAHLVLNFAELLERLHWSNRVVARRARVHGREHLAAANAGGGYFVLTAHLGNWELLTRILVAEGSRLVIITKYLRNRFFDEIWRRSRRKFGLGLLEESGSGLQVLRTLKAGRPIGFILDQYTGPPHGIEADFFGVRTWCPKGLAVLNARAQVPIVPFYILRADDGRHDLHVGAPLKLPVDDVRAHVEACNREIENWIRIRPEQFNWVHRRFKGALDYAAPLPWES